MMIFHSAVASFPCSPPRPLWFRLFINGMKSILVWDSTPMQLWFVLGFWFICIRCKHNQNVFVFHCHGFMPVGHVGETVGMRGRCSKLTASCKVQNFNILSRCVLKGSFIQSVFPSIVASVSCPKLPRALYPPFPYIERFSWVRLITDFSETMP